MCLRAVVDVARQGSCGRASDVGKMPSWARSARRILVAECPDCSDIFHMELRVHVSHKEGQLIAEVRPEPLVHECDKPGLQVVA